MTKFRPENFMIMPTMACQASCKYCFAKKTGRIMDRATALAALDFISQIAPEGKDFHLTFHGGEPLLAGEDFYRWILPEAIARFGRRIHLSVQSNLWAMTDSLAELFAQYQVSIGTSLDGPRDMCDEQRGDGYYDKTMAGIDILRKHGIAAGIICTFTGENAGRAADVFAQSKNPYSIHGAVPVLEAEDSKFHGTASSQKEPNHNRTGGGENHGTASSQIQPNQNLAEGGETHGAVSAEQMTHLLLDSYESYKNDPAHCRITTIDAFAKGSFDGKGNTCTFFDCLGVFAAIDPDGDVYTCQRFCGMKEYSVGNVLGGLGEEDILSSPGYALLRAAEDAKKEACGDCSHWDYCMGGCLYSTLTSGGKKDPYCEAFCKVYDCIGHDMALEMGSAMLGRDVPMPVLAMAGDRPHPYDMRRSKQRLKMALEYGKSPEGFGDLLRSRFPENDLNKLYLHLTFDCPLRCAHCYAEGGEAKCTELTPDRFAGIVGEAADRRFHSVVITGGEPLAYNGFDEFCKLVSGIDRKGTKLILRTSLGFSVQPDRLKSICQLFDEIVVSVDGDRESHDSRRGTGRYDQTVANLEAAVALGAADKFGLTATITRDQANGPEGESVYELAERLGIRKVRMRPVLPIGRAEGTQRETWQICAEEIRFDEKFQPRHTCGLGQNLYVKPDGSTYPCYAWCAPDKQLGDLSGESLGEVLDREELYEYCSHDVDTNEKCRTCEVRYLCGGICKAWVNDRENVDSGDFDCTDRKEYYRQLAASYSERSYMSF